MASEDPVIRETNMMRHVLRARERRMNKLMLESYQDAYNEMLARIERDAVKRADQYGQVVFDDEAVRLLDIEQEMSKLTPEVERQIRDNNRQAAIEGMEGAQRQLEALDQADVRTGFGRVDTEAVHAMAERATERRPITQMLDRAVQHQKEKVSRILLTSTIKGDNPRHAARLLTKELQGVQGAGLSRWMTVARTEMMDASRNGQTAIYQRNGDILRGKEWFAANDERTCVACLALDGTVYPLDAAPEFHQSCRCSLLPVLRGRKREQQRETGTEWFRSQDNDVKARILGPRGLDAYLDGQVDLIDFVDKRHNSGWRSAYYQTSLEHAMRKHNVQWMGNLGAPALVLFPDKSMIALWAKAKSWAAAPDVIGGVTLAVVFITSPVDELLFAAWMGRNIPSYVRTTRRQLSQLMEAAGIEGTIPPSLLHMYYGQVARNTEQFMFDAYRGGFPRRFLPTRGPVRNMDEWMHQRLKSISESLARPIGQFVMKGVVIPSAPIATPEAIFEKVAPMLPAGRQMLALPAGDTGWMVNQVPEIVDEWSAWGAMANDLRTAAAVQPGMPLYDIDAGEFTELAETTWQGFFEGRTRPGRTGPNGGTFASIVGDSDRGGVVGQVWWHPDPLVRTRYSLLEMQTEMDASDLMSEGWELAGEFHRQMRGDVTVYHASLALRPQYQGLGFAEQFNQRAFSYYITHGIETVEIQAAQIGAYTWAKNALFQFVNLTTLDMVRQNRYKVLEMIDAGHITEEDLSDYLNQIVGAEEIGDPLRSHELAVLGSEKRWTRLLTINGETLEHELWFGKAIMINSSWRGRIELVPPTDTTWFGIPTKRYPQELEYPRLFTSNDVQHLTVSEGFVSRIIEDFVRRANQLDDWSPEAVQRDVQNRLFGVRNRLLINPGRISLADAIAEVLPISLDDTQRAIFNLAVQRHSFSISQVFAHPPVVRTPPPVAAPAVTQQQTGIISSPQLARVFRPVSIRPAVVPRLRMIDFEERSRAVTLLDDLVNDVLGQRLSEDMTNNLVNYPRTVGDFLQEADSLLWESLEGLEETPPSLYDAQVQFEATTLGRMTVPRPGWNVAVPFEEDRSVYYTAALWLYPVARALGIRIDPTELTDLVAGEIIDSDETAYNAMTTVLNRDFPTLPLFIVQEARERLQWAVGQVPDSSALYQRTGNPFTAYTPAFNQLPSEQAAPELQVLMASLLQAWMSEEDATALSETINFTLLGGLRSGMAPAVALRQTIRLSEGVISPHAAQVLGQIAPILSRQELFRPMGRSESMIEAQRQELVADELMRDVFGANLSQVARRIMANPDRAMRVAVEEATRVFEEDGTQPLRASMVADVVQATVSHVDYYIDPAVLERVTQIFADTMPSHIDNETTHRLMQAARMGRFLGHLWTTRSTIEAALRIAVIDEPEANLAVGMWLEHQTAHPLPVLDYERAEVLDLIRQTVAGIFGVGAAEFPFVAEFDPARLTFEPLPLDEAVVMAYYRAGANTVFLDRLRRTVVPALRARFDTWRSSPNYVRLLPSTLIDLEYDQARAAALHRYLLSSTVIEVGILPPFWQQWVSMPERRLTPQAHVRLQRVLSAVDIGPSTADFLMQQVEQDIWANGATPLDEIVRRLTQTGWSPEDVEQIQWAIAGDPVLSAFGLPPAPESYRSGHIRFTPVSIVNRPAQYDERIAFDLFHNYVAGGLDEGYEMLADDEEQQQEELLALYERYYSGQIPMLPDEIYTEIWRIWGEVEGSERSSLLLHVQRAYANGVAFDDLLADQEVELTLELDLDEEEYARFFQLWEDSEVFEEFRRQNRSARVINWQAADQPGADRTLRNAVLGAWWQLSNIPGEQAAGPVYRAMEYYMATQLGPPVFLEPTGYYLRQAVETVYAAFNTPLTRSELDIMVQAMIHAAAEANPPAPILTPRQVMDRMATMADAWVLARESLAAGTMAYGVDPGDWINVEQPPERWTSTDANIWLDEMLSNLADANPDVDLTDAWEVLRRDPAWVEYWELRRQAPAPPLQRASAAPEIALQDLSEDVWDRIAELVEQAGFSEFMSWAGLEEHIENVFNNLFDRPTWTSNPTTLSQFIDRVEFHLESTLEALIEERGQDWVEYQESDRWQRFLNNMWASLTGSSTIIEAWTAGLDPNDRANYAPVALDPSMESLLNRARVALGQAGLLDFLNLVLGEGINLEEMRSLLDDWLAPDTWDPMSREELVRRILQTVDDYMVAGDWGGTQPDWEQFSIRFTQLMGVTPTAPPVTTRAQIVAAAIRAGWELEDIQGAIMETSLSFYDRRDVEEFLADLRAYGLADEVRRLRDITFWEHLQWVGEAEPEPIAVPIPAPIRPSDPYKDIILDSLSDELKNEIAALRRTNQWAGLEALDRSINNYTRTSDVLRRYIEAKQGGMSHLQAMAEIAPDLLIEYLDETAASQRAMVASLHTDFMSQLIGSRYGGSAQRPIEEAQQEIEAQHLRASSGPDAEEIRLLRLAIDAQLSIGRPPYQQDISELSDLLQTNVWDTLMAEVARSPHPVDPTTLREYLQRRLAAGFSLTTEDPYVRWYARIAGQTPEEALDTLRDAEGGGPGTVQNPKTPGERDQRWLDYLMEIRPLTRDMTKEQVHTIWVEHRYTWGDSFWEALGAVNEISPGYLNNYRHQWLSRVERWLRNEPYTPRATAPSSTVAYFMLTQMLHETSDPLVALRLWGRWQAGETLADLGIELEERHLRIIENQLAWEQAQVDHVPLRDGEMIQILDSGETDGFPPAGSVVRVHGGGEVINPNSGWRLVVVEGPFFYGGVPLRVDRMSVRRLTGARIEMVTSQATPEAAVAWAEASKRPGEQFQIYRDQPTEMSYHVLFYRELFAPLPETGNQIMGRAPLSPVLRAGSNQVLTDHTQAVVWPEGADDPDQYVRRIQEVIHGELGERAAQLYLHRTDFSGVAHFEAIWQSGHHEDYEALRALVRFTQEDLRLRGITHVRVYRGMHNYDPGGFTGDQVLIEGTEMTSWSIYRDVAEVYTSYGVDVSPDDEMEAASGVVLSAFIPVSMVALLFPYYGPDPLEEFEPDRGLPSSGEIVTLLPHEATIEHYGEPYYQLLFTGDFGDIDWSEVQYVEHPRQFEPPPEDTSDDPPASPQLDESLVGLREWLDQYRATNQAPGYVPVPITNAQWEQAEQILTVWVRSQGPEVTIESSVSFEQWYMSLGVDPVEDDLPTQEIQDWVTSRSEMDETQRYRDWLIANDVEPFTPPFQGNDWAMITYRRMPAEFDVQFENHLNADQIPPRAIEALVTQLLRQDNLTEMLSAYMVPLATEFTPFNTWAWVDSLGIDDEVLAEDIGVFVEKRVLWPRFLGWFHTQLADSLFGEFAGVADSSIIPDDLQSLNYYMDSIFEAITDGLELETDEEWGRLYDQQGEIQDRAGAIWFPRFRRMLGG